MTIAFVFDKTGDGAEKPLEGPDIRRSPFVEYVVLSPVFRHHFGTFTPDEAASIAQGTTDLLFVYPIGLYRYFHRSWLSGICSGSSAVQPLLRTVERLRKVRGMYLLLDLSWETATPQQVDAIPAIAQALNFPAQNIILFSSNPATQVLSSLPARHGYLAIGAWFFEFYTHSMHNNQINAARAILAHKRAQLNAGAIRHERIFLSLNRRMRYHRLLLAGYLHSRGYLEHGFFSFGGREANPDDNYLRADIISQAKEIVADAAIARRFSEKDIDKVLEKEPFELDVAFTDLRQDSAVFNRAVLATSDGMLHFFTTSLFSIVTETDYGGSNFDFLLTEKVFKPILFGHPFILISSPGALGELSLLGYKGFDPAIDSGYDKIYDPALRFLRTMDAIDTTIGGLQSSPLARMKELQRIAEFNQENFISGTPGRLTDFLYRLSRDLPRFKHAMTRSGVRRESFSSQEPTISFEGARYHCVSSSQSQRINFDSGFSEYEPAHRGRWCSAIGAITVWLEGGNWELILSLNVLPPGEVPVIRRNGLSIECDVKTDEDRTAILVRLPDVRQFVTLTCCARSTFIPAQLKSDSTDWRILSFWLRDDILLRRVDDEIAVRSGDGS